MLKIVKLFSLLCVLSWSCCWDERRWNDKVWRCEVHRRKICNAGWCSCSDCSLVFEYFVHEPYKYNNLSQRETVLCFLIGLASTILRFRNLQYVSSRKWNNWRWPDRKFLVFNECNGQLIIYSRARKIMCSGRTVGQGSGLNNISQFSSW